jgi:hypothetical protein
LAAPFQPSYTLRVGGHALAESRFRTARRLARRPRISCCAGPPSIATPAGRARKSATDARHHASRWERRGPVMNS